ncbi:MAG: tripartite tricarboxylate transporter substrate binding protein [Pseudomonadota bacterium]
MTNSVFRRVLLGLLLAASTGIVHAQANYPNKPIRVVIGFAAGGGTDVVLRAIGQKLGTILGTSVIVDNKPGANGNIAGETVVKAPADGYTLLYNTSSLVLNTGLSEKLPFDFQKDLTPIALTANSPLVLVIGPAVQAESYAQFVAQAKAKPGSFSFGSAGNGNITHLAALIFQREAGIRGVHIPYKSEAFAMTDVAGGHVEFYVGTAPGVVPLVKEKRLTALAVASAHRLRSLPDTPTFAEVGLKTGELGSWSGLMAPAGTPQAIIDKLNGAVQKALADPDLRATLAAQNSEPRGGSAAEYTAFLRSELKKWGEVIRAENIKAD